MGDGRLACRNCGAAFAPLALAGHYGRSVEIDLCAGCHLLWFDSLESVRLAGPGLLALIGAMAEAQHEPHRPLAADAGCPRCGERLKRSANRSRFGATLHLECPRGHGHLQSFALWLAEKGLWRELSGVDRARLLAAGDALHCLNCGAALGDAARCSYCETPAGVLDVARLAAAVDVDGATEADPLHRTPLAHHARNCVACGAALPPGIALACTSCGATLAVGDLGAVRAALDRLAPALQAHHAAPLPHVRARRLERQRADLPRQRAWIDEMNRSAGGEAREPEPDEAREALRELFEGRPLPALRWIGWGVLLGLVGLWLAR